MEEDVIDRNLTAIIDEWMAAKPEPPSQLIELIYQDLRRVAHGYMRHERPDHTMQATELVNEAYRRVFQGKPFSWENRTHFFRVIAQKMRHILAEHARRRGEERHGGQWIKVHVTDMATIEDQQRSQFLALNDALEELARLNPRLAQVVELHKLVGLTHQETAAILDLSEKTVRNDWVFARAWLKQRVPDPRSQEK